MNNNNIDQISKFGKLNVLDVLYGYVLNLV